MKILLVNKYLYESGGAETYTIRLGEYYKSIGHDVQYFGMYDERNTVGNEWNLLTDNIDFHKRPLKNYIYPFKVIYSPEARRKIKQLIKLFKPDVLHLNNFNYQLTPSIMYEAKKNNVPIFLTTHDYQCVCPGHCLLDDKNVICEKCINNGFFNCVKNNCIHSSKVRSFLGAMESIIYHGLNTYSLLDKIICPSGFMEKKLNEKPVFRGRTVTLHNFVQTVDKNDLVKKGEYVLYFGRFSVEKGISTLIKVCKCLPEVQFIFAGEGKLYYKNMLKSVQNIKNVGFLKGDSLKKIISEACFSICPSEWYENCPFSVMEAQMYGTPVIGADIGGIPELIVNGKTGFLFQSGNADDLAEKVATLWNDRKLLKEMTENCFNAKYDTIDVYAEKVLGLYNEAITKKIPPIQ